MAVDFNAKQLEFTRYIRDPENNALPSDVKPERMAMYRELIFNNIDTFLAGNFPVLRELLNDKAWAALIQDFFLKHRSTTPYFAEIAGEFLDYLQNERNDQPEDYPFLLELAHYEWVEMALSIANEEPARTDHEVDDWLNTHIGLSPLVWPLIYSYPVHKISPNYIPVEPSNQPTCLVVYRDSNDEIKFSEINVLTYRLLELVQEREWPTVQSILDQIAVEMPQLKSQAVVESGLAFIKQLSEKGLILSR